MVADLWRPGVRVLVLVLVMGLLPLAAATAGEAPTKYVDVSPSVVMAENQWGSNSTCVALPEGLVFVDAGLNTEAAGAFRAAMEKKFGKKTLALVLTHGHLDHFLGMGAFSDVPVIAAETGRGLFEKQLSIEWDEKAIEAYAGIFTGFRESIETVSPFLPTIWFQGSMTLGNGDKVLKIQRTGGHTSDSTVLEFPAEGVVLAGDLLQVERFPYFGDPTTDMDAWITTLEGWERPDVKDLCPGHGPCVPASYVTGVRSYFQDVLAVVARLKKEGKTLKEVINHPDLPAGYWPQDLPTPGWWPYCFAAIYSCL
jgi:glyoxylase-like metal-dependent hydrolase (beta-lactamase superfamily II)